MQVVHLNIKIFLLVKYVAYVIIPVTFLQNSYNSLLKENVSKFRSTGTAIISAEQFLLK